MPEYSFVGKSVPRIDAADKVTGAALFSADVVLPRMLHGKVLRSPYPHAIIRRLDMSRARALAGVMAAITAADVPGYKVKGEMTFSESPHLARDKVLYAGQPVAVIAAEDPYIAEEALGLIEVEHEVLEPLLDVMEASKPGAPLIYPDLYANLVSQGPPGKDTVPSNIAWRVDYKRGDPEAGFREADLVLENTFRTQTVHQGYIEPMVAVANIDLSGRVTVWTPNQGIFSVRKLVADFVSLPLSRIKVVPVEVGGAFGGKTYQLLAPLCALLAVKTGRPVRMEMTREEVLKASRPAPSSLITLKVGVKRDGRLTAASARMIFDEGAYPERPYSVVASITGLGHYKIPNLNIEALDVLTNKVPSGSYRAPSAPQAAFAVESQMDLIARALDMDPLRFRIKNAVEEGDPLPDGTTFPRIGFKETLERMAEYLKQKGKMEGENRGRGVACGFWRGGAGLTSAQVNINSDGSASLLVGTTDISGSRTSMAQIVAEELGIPLEKVSVVVGDTDTAPYADLSVGSRTTYHLGAAVHRACQEVKSVLAREAALRLEVYAANIEFAGGIFRVKGKPERAVSLAESAARLVAGTRGEGPVTGRGSIVMPPFAPMFAVHTVEVEADRETGRVRILSYTAAQDVGKAINPALVEGQIQGAISQGIGWALMENYVFNRGVLQNTTLLDYRMPTAADIPFIEPLLVEVASAFGTYGLRPAGEPPMVPVLATIANAIHSATGMRLKELPMDPEAILNAMKAHNNSRQERIKPA